jgi:hypothetical protein
LFGYESKNSFRATVFVFITISLQQEFKICRPAQKHLKQIEGSGMGEIRNARNSQNN